MIKENTIFSLENFNKIHELNNNYLNYIKSYNTIIKELTQKLSVIKKDKETKTKEIINNLSEEETQNLSLILKYENTFPTLLQLYTENICKFISDLEKEIKYHETFLKEKENLINEIKSKFEEAKNDYTKKNKEIGNSEKSFLKSMLKTEEILYTFFSQEKKEKKDHKKKNIASKIISNINLNNNQNIVTKEQVDNCINTTKKLENNYKESIESINLSQDNYIQMDNNSSENIKNNISDLLKESKLFLINILTPMKNSFVNTISEIDKFISDLTKSDGNQIIESIENHFKNNMIKKEEYIPKNYDLKILKNEQDNKEQKKKSTNKKNLFSSLNIFKKKSNSSPLTKDGQKVSVLEDGLEVMNFIDNEFALLTTRKMINTFKLINNGGYNMNEEEEKMTTKKLINKIFCNFKRKRAGSSSNDKDNNINLKED